MKAGIIYPQSKVHPEIMTDYVGALKISLDEYISSKKIELVYEGIGLGGDGKVIVEKVEKLLLIDEVDLLVAFMDFPFLSLVTPLINASDKLLILVNTGANYPEEWLLPSNVVCLSLQHSFCCWLTGALAAESNGQTAAVASSFYDCGYAHLSAMVESFSKSGGSVEFNFINHLSNTETLNIISLQEFLRHHPLVKKILCVFDKSPALSIIDGFSSLKELFPLELYFSPLIFENTKFECIVEQKGLLVKGYSTWLQSNFEKVTEFTALFNNKYGRMPSSVSLLGIETALLLISIIDKQQDCKHPKQLIELFNKSVINSPRGNLFIDSDTHFFISPIYEISINDHLEMIKIDQLQPILNRWKQFIANTPKAANSGWLNTYLCY